MYECLRTLNLRALFGSCLLVNTALSFEKTQFINAFLALQNNVCGCKMIQLKTNIVFYINDNDFKCHDVCIEGDCVHSNDCIYKENLFFVIKVTFHIYRNMGQVTKMCAKNTGLFFAVLNWFKSLFRTRSALPLQGKRLFSTSPFPVKYRCTL